MVEEDTEQGSSVCTVSLWMLWGMVACAGMFLYGWTAQSTISWQDSGMLQWRMLSADYVGDLGLALAHPLYIGIGRAFLCVPFVRDTALLNFCSGAGMALALANVSVLGCLLTGRRWIGLMTAGLLAVMHTPWWLSCVAEVYTWNIAFFTAELIFFIMCVRKPSLGALAGLFLCNGLNLSVHNMALLNLPVYGIWALFFVYRNRLPFLAIVVACAAYVCGAAPLLWLLVQETLQTGSLQSSFASMLVGRYAAPVLNIGLNQPMMRVNAALSSLNFLHFGLILGVWGLICMVKRIGKPLAWSLLALLGVHGLFFVRFSVPDQFTFILPTLVLFSLGMAIGMDVLARRSAVWLRVVVAACLFSIVLMPLTYAALPPILAALNLNVKRERVLAFRDEMRYWLVPWKHNEHSAEQFARAALLEASPAGIIVCDSTSYYPLLLMKERMRGVEAVSIEDYSVMARRYGADPEAIHQLLCERSVFCISPTVNFIAEKYSEDVGFKKETGLILYRLGMENQAVCLSVM